MGKQNGQRLPQQTPTITPVQPNQDSILQEATRLYNEGFGFTPYPGPTYVPMSPTSQNALAQIEALAQQSNPLLGQATAATQQALAWGGLSPDQRAAMAPLQAVAGGNYSVGSQGLYNQIFNQAGQPSAASTYLSGIASGQQGVTTPGVFADIRAAAGAPTAAQEYLTATARGDYLAQPNPYLQAMIDDRSQQIANQVKDAYSGMGRYGSSALNRDLTDRLAQFQAGVLADNYEAERARQLQAADMIDSARWQQLATQYQSALGQTNAEAANIGNQMDASKTIDAALANLFGTQLSAAGGYSNAQATDIGNIMSASGALSDAYANALNRVLGAAGNVPGLTEAQYAPALHLAQVGAAREADQAAQLADLVNRYNYQQQAPMDALSWLNALVTGSAYSPSVAPPTVTMSPWSNAIG